MGPFDALVAGIEAGTVPAGVFAEVGETPKIRVRVEIPKVSRRKPEVHDPPPPARQLRS